MAVLERIARLRLEDGAGLNFRQWTATAQVLDTPQGQTVLIDFAQTTGGVPPDEATDTLEIIIEEPNGAGVIRTFTIAPSVESDQVGFTMTANGQTGGSPRHGTVEIVIRAVLATGAPTSQYDLRTDRSSGNTTPAGFTLSQRDQGWIRGTTTATHTLSNVSAGGGKNSPFAYDDSVFHRVVLGSAPFFVRSLTLTVGTELTGGASSSTATFDRSHSAVVDERFPAAATVRQTNATPETEGLTGQPYTVLTSQTQDSATFDPRLKVPTVAGEGQDGHHFQVNDSGFGLAKATTPKQMTTDQSGFLWTRIVNARNEGRNGITVQMTLDPQNPGSNVSHTATTTTLDGQAGWTATPLEWTSVKPGGVWDKITDVLAPSDIDGDVYLLGGADAYGLIAPNNDLEVLVQGGNLGQPGDHWTPGEDLTAGAAILDTAAGTLVEVDAGAATAILTRAHPVHGAQFLDAAHTWQNMIDGGGQPVAAFKHPLGEFAPGARLYVAQIPAAATATWETYDVALIVRLEVGGFPNRGSANLTVVDPDEHAGESVDVGNLLGLPVPH